MVREHHAIFGCFRFRRLMAEDLFGDLSPSARESLLAISRTLKLKKGDVLIEKGDLFDVFILSKGEASARYYNHLTRNEIRAAVTKGEIIGLVETISNSFSMTKIQTDTPCVFWKVKRDDLLKFLSDQPELSLKIVNHLSLKLHEAYKAIES